MWKVKLNVVISSHILALAFGIDSGNIGSGASVVVPLRKYDVRVSFYSEFLYS